MTVFKNPGIFACPDYSWKEEVHFEQYSLNFDDPQSYHTFDIIKELQIISPNWTTLFTAKKKRKTRYFTYHYPSVVFVAFQSENKNNNNKNR